MATTAAHGASLQAVRSHRGAGILDHPGETDLSAHVDFAALAAASGARTFGRSDKAISCVDWGSLNERKSSRGRATTEQRRAINAALQRLIATDQMGTLFRVLAVGDDRSAAPTGFSDAI